MYKILLNKIDNIIISIEKELEFYTNFINIQNNVAEVDKISQVLSHNITIWSWIHLDSLLSDHNIYKELFKNFKYNHFNMCWADLFEKFIKCKTTCPSTSDRLFLAKIITQSKEKLTEDDIKFLGDFFQSIERKIHIEPKYSYLFFKLFLSINTNNEVIWIYKNQRNDFSHLKNFEKLRLIRNNVAHEFNTLDNDPSVKSLKNWKEIYWNAFKIMLIEIKKVITNKKIHYSFEKIGKISK